MQTTINTQLITAELMHMADEPTMVGRKRTPRVPIVVTGNDFGKLYIPLVRANRMISYEWRPTPEEVAFMMTRIFPDLSHGDCIHFIDGLKYEAGVDSEKLQIAYFAELKTRLDDDHVWNHIKSVGLPRAAEVARKLIYFSSRRQYNLSELIARGVSMLQSADFADHLKSKD